MKIVRPNSKELAVLLEAVDPKRLSLLLQILQVEPSETQPLPTDIVLKLAVFDWMTALNVLSEIDRQRALLTAGPALSMVVAKFEREEAEDRLRTPSTFAIFDFRFMAVRVFGLGDAQRPIFDLNEDKFLEVLPHHTLTGLSCDLNVLLIRLFDRMAKVRKLQERTDAHATSPSQQPDSPAAH